MGIIPYTVSLITAGLLSILIAIFSWKRQTSNSARPLSGLMLCVAVWIISQALQDVSSGVTLKLFWYYFKFMAIIVTPVAWIVLTLQYTRNERFLNKRSLPFLLTIPLLSVISVVTNEFLHTFETNITFTVADSIPKGEGKEQFWFWVHTYYSYALLFLGIIILFTGLFRLPSIYRKQVIILLIGALIPWVSNIMTVFKLVQFPYSDITPLALLLTGICYFWALFRYKLLDLVPIARHALIENMNDLIMVLDSQSRLIDINPAAAEFLNTKASIALGKNIEEVLSKWSDLAARFRHVTEANEKIAIRQNGRNLYFHISITPIWNKKKIWTGTLLVFKDITELEDTIRELKKSRKFAEAANEAKGQFLANMSHEIRTPMNAIIGMSDLLSATALNPEQKEYLSMIQNSASSLLTIINDILDFSKIEAGKLQIEKIPFLLRELMQDTLNPLILQAKNKNLRFSWDLPEGIPETVVGDPLRLRQILINLIGNAIKFTPEEGQVDVTVSQTGTNSDQIYLRFSVADTGPGIPDEKLGRLFESFHQLDSSTTRKYGGTGLGLTIVKSLVEMMGGNITVKSKYHAGSTFTFVLPFFRPSADDIALGESAAAEDPQMESCLGEHIRVLLAEDNKVNQVLMLKMIEKFKWSLDIADNGIKMLEKFSSGTYDILLMDIQMPEMDGFETTARIRELERQSGGHIPIIALTANAMTGDKEKCLAAGMDDYLSKPIRSQNLYEMVRKYLCK